MHCIWENVYGNNLMLSVFKSREMEAKKNKNINRYFNSRIHDENGKPYHKKKKNTETCFYIFILLCISLVRLFDCFRHLLLHKMFVKHYIIIRVTLLYFFFCLFQKDQIPLAPSANDVVNCVSKGKSQVSFCYSFFLC